MSLATFLRMATPLFDQEMIPCHPQQTKEGGIFTPRQSCQVSKWLMLSVQPFPKRIQPPSLSTTFHCTDSYYYIVCVYNCGPRMWVCSYSMPTLKAFTEIMSKENGPPVANTPTKKILCESNQPFVYWSYFGYFSFLLPTAKKKTYFGHNWPRLN